MVGNSVSNFGDFRGDYRLCSGTLATIDYEKGSNSGDYDTGWRLSATFDYVSDYDSSDYATMDHAGARLHGPHAAAPGAQGPAQAAPRVSGAGPVVAACFRIFRRAKITLGYKITANFARHAVFIAWVVCLHSQTEKPLKTPLKAK